MILTKLQVSAFWRLWASACRAQGWVRPVMTSAEIDAQRKEVLRRMGFESLHLVDRGAGFGRVKAELELLAGRVSGAIESDHPEMDQARRLRWVLDQDVLCLQVYLGDSAVGYVEQIARDKFDFPRLAPVDMDLLGTDPTFRTDRKTGRVVEGPSQLEQLLMTVHARLDGMRKEAGHTIHEMHARAGTRCPCKMCRRAKPPVAAGAKAPTATTS